MPVSPGGTKYDDDELDALFEAVGFVVVQWGQSEQSLDMLVAMIYQQLGGKRFAKRLPKMLATKLDFLHKCFSNIVALAPFKAEAGKLIADFGRLSDRRHDLMHGAVASLSSQNGAFLPTRTDHRGSIRLK